MDLRSLAFDYHQPDLSALDIQDGKVLAFTCHSIEQIPALSEKLFREMIEHIPRFECFHFEPVGWQIRATTGEPGVGSMSEYAEHHDYNQNFWHVLTELQEAGLVRIEAAFPDICGPNPENSISIVKWHPA